MMLSLSAVDRAVAGLSFGYERARRHPTPPRKSRWGDSYLGLDHASLAMRRSVHLLKLFGLERLDRAGVDFVDAHGAGHRECLEPALDQLLLVFLIEPGGREPLA